MAPNFFFHSTGQASQTSPELIFHIINMSQDSSVSSSVVETLALQFLVELDHNWHLSFYTLKFFWKHFKESELIFTIVIFIKTCHQYLIKWRLKKVFAHPKMYIVYISYIRYRVVFSDKHGMLFFLLLGCLYISQWSQNWYKIAFQILFNFFYKTGDGINQCKVEVEFTSVYI